jgi:hypothetical protein
MGSRDRPHLGRQPIRSVVVFRWANERRVNGMPTPTMLAKQAYELVCSHPLYPLSWLMRKKRVNA